MFLALLSSGQRSPMLFPGMCWSLSDACDGQSARLDPDVVQLIRWQQLERLLTW